MYKQSSLSTQTQGVTLLNRMEGARELGHVLVIDVHVYLHIYFGRRREMREPEAEGPRNQCLEVAFARYSAM